MAGVVGEVGKGRGMNGKERWNRGRQKIMTEEKERKRVRTREEKEVEGYRTRKGRGGSKERGGKMGQIKREILPSDHDK